MRELLYVYMMHQVVQIYRTTLVPKVFSQSVLATTTKYARDEHYSAFVYFDSTCESNLVHLPGGWRCRKL